MKATRRMMARLYDDAMQKLNDDFYRRVEELGGSIEGEELQSAIEMAELLSDLRAEVTPLGNIEKKPRPTGYGPSMPLGPGPGSDAPTIADGYGPSLFLGPGPKCD